MTEIWRRLAFYLLLFAILGTGIELIFLEHFEDPWQWAPIALLGAGLVLGAAVVLRPSRPTVRALQLLMISYVLSAGVGLYLHLKANVEFELELRPTMANTELILETLKGAIPALAPGVMVQLGLLGLLACFRHPTLMATGGDFEQKEAENQLLEG
ncbi:MAG: hypothetical protein ABGY10_08990 [bacterium]|nr:hypothetical protein [Gemmatimonadota bacterium]